MILQVHDKRAKILCIAMTVYVMIIHILVHHSHSNTTFHDGHGMVDLPYLIPLLIIVLGAALSIDAGAFFLAGSTAKHFHNRNVSSAAADTTVLPSGDIAMCSTRDVCPTNKGTK